MKLVILLLLAVCWTTVKSNDNEAVIVLKTKQVLGIAEDLGTQLTSFFADASKSKILKMLKQAPFLGVAAGLVDYFGADATAEALTAIQNSLDNLDGQIENLSSLVSDVRDDLMTEFFREKIHDEMETILLSEQEYDSYRKNIADGQKERAKTNFLYYYDDFTMKKLKDAIRTLFSNINGNIRHDGTYAESIYTSTKGGLTEIAKEYLLLQKRIATGIATYTLACVLTGDVVLSECQQRGEELLGDSLNDFEYSFEAEIKKCKDNVKDNMKTDVTYLLNQYDTDKKSNQEMADIIQEKIKTKYFWNDYTVVVYPPVSGHENHWGYNFLSLFRVGKRNTRVLSGNRVTDPTKTILNFNGAYPNDGTDAAKLKAKGVYFKLKRDKIEDLTCFQSVVVYKKDMDLQDVGCSLGKNGDFSWGGFSKLDREWKKADTASGRVSWKIWRKHPKFAIVVEMCDVQVVMQTNSGAVLGHNK